VRNARRNDPFLEVFVLRNAAIAALVLGFSVTAMALPVFADSSLTIAGSTALLPLVKDAAGVYQAKHSDVKISVSGGGSGTGLNQVAAKAIDIGDSDIVAPAGSTLTDNSVAVIGFAVIVDPKLGLKSLTKKQVQQVFNGAVTNWKDVGGPDQKIVVVNRTRGSGTRAVFEKTIIAPEKVSETGLTEDATGTVVSVVSTTPGAVSYAAFSGTHGKPVTEVAIDGVAPTDANILVGKYPFWSYEHMFTNGAPTGAAKDFINFVKSSDDLLKANGFIKISDMKVTETDR
jgi:phosphate transport system substrate-binding protein